MLLFLLACSSAAHLPPTGAPAASGPAAVYGPAPLRVARTDGQAAIPDISPVTTPTGLKYWVLRAGTGAVPTPGQTVSVHYTGWLADGSKFDSSRDRGTPLEFAVGAGRVIKGWDEGVSTMAVGEVRRLEIPPHLGYGERGAGGRIPGGATIVFEVELLALR